MDYYSLGNRNFNLNDEKRSNYFNCRQDRSNNMIDRNYLSINQPYYCSPVPEYKKYASIENVYKEGNSYLNVCNQYHNKEAYSVSPSLTNIGTYSIQKKKKFVDEYDFSPNNLNIIRLKENSKIVSIEEFQKLKNENVISNQNSPYSEINKKQPVPFSPIFAKEINNQNFIFDRSEKNLRRFKPDIVPEDKLTFNRHNCNDNFRTSSDMPNWLKVCDIKKLNDINDQYIKNKESLHVLSKFNRWITVTPNKKDRKRPLENTRITNLESSKIIPYWMQVKPVTKVDDIFKKARVDYSLKGPKSVILIDKDQSKAKMNLMTSNYKKNANSLY